MSSWGSGTWGSSAWGSGDTAISSTFRLIAGVAIGENRIRLEFTSEPYYSGLFDLYDASDARRFEIRAIKTTIGADGASARDVTVAQVSRVLGESTKLDLTLDRSMTPYPAQYTIIATGVAAKPGVFVLIDSNFTTITLFANYRELNRPVIDLGAKNRDFAMPQTRSAMFDPLPDPNNALNLGTYVIDDTGDYAFDEGIVSFKKRVLRRCFSRPLSFAHMPDYGVGVQTFGKRLQTLATQSDLVSAIEEQISREPEVSQVKAALIPRANKPGLFYIRILARLKSGKGLRFDVPLEQ
jgi:hypothetical protein